MVNLGILDESCNTLDVLLIRICVHVLTRLASSRAHMPTFLESLASYDWRDT